MATNTHIAVTDQRGGFYVRTPDGALLRDEVAVKCYGSAEDAIEVAAALTEGRAIRPPEVPMLRKPACVRAAPFAVSCAHCGT